MSHLLGVDVGATFVRAVVATDEFEIGSRVEERTPENWTETAFPRVLLETVERVCRAEGIEPASVDAAGVGAIGPLDRSAGVVADPANVSAEHERIQVVRPLQELLETSLVVLHNDTTCGVIGERQFADAATDDMVYLTISTGIGAGVVVDDEVLYGHGGNAGEVGHTTIDPTDAMTCQCGATGHWEAYCSGGNLPRYASHLRRAEGVETTLPVDDPTFGAADVFDRVGEDPLADLVVERIGRWNAIGVANLVQAYAPTYVAVGGAVALNNPDLILDPVRRGVPERVTLEVPDIEVTDLGEDVVLKGALYTAREQLDRDGDVI